MNVYPSGVLTLVPAAKPGHKFIEKKRRDRKNDDLKILFIAPLDLGLQCNQV